MATIKFLTVSSVGLSVLGLLICWYALYVETAKELNDDYEAMCDINQHMSCSKVLTSQYGKGFGVIKYIAGENSVFNQPNPVYGAVFYLSLILLSASSSTKWSRVQVALCVISNLGSLYLATILIFILSDFCVVCVATYLVNMGLLIANYKRHAKLQDLEASARTPAKNKKNK